MKKLLVAGVLAITAAACGDAQAPATPPDDAQETSTPPGMVLIPAGSFLMGDADGQDLEKPVHEVELDAFYMDTHEVTLEEFGQFVDATSYVTDAERNAGSIIWNGEDWEKTEGINWRFDAAGEAHTPEEKNQPVTHLSWNDATAYAQWIDNDCPPRPSGNMPPAAEKKATSSLGGTSHWERLSWPTYRMRATCKS